MQSPETKQAIKISMDNLFAPVAMGMAITANRPVIETGIGGRHEPALKRITPATAYENGIITKGE